MMKMLVSMERRHNRSILALNDCIDLCHSLKVLDCTYVTQCCLCCWKTPKINNQFLILSRHRMKDIVIGNTPICLLRKPWIPLEIT